MIKYNNRKSKILFLVIAAISILLINIRTTYAIGEFSLGIIGGLTYDPNNLENDIQQYNTYIEVLKENDSGAKGSQIKVPYSFVWGFNIRYHFNFLLIRLAGHFAKPGEGVKASYTPTGGPENEIKISTFQNSFPLSIGFLLPLKEKTFIYLGGGITYHLAYIKITQSNPGAGSNRRNRYTEDFPGWHLLIGAEVPLLKRFTISLEWIHQEGKSYSLNNGGLDENGNAVYTPKRVIDARGDFILFGVNYYISI